MRRGIRQHSLSEAAVNGLKSLSPALVKGSSPSVSSSGLKVWGDSHPGPRACKSNPLLQSGIPWLEQQNIREGFRIMSSHTHPATGIFLQKTWGGPGLNFVSQAHVRLFETGAPPTVGCPPPALLP